MKDAKRHIETMRFQIGSIRGALNMHQNFTENGNQCAAKMTIKDALAILERLENNLNALKNAQ